MMQADHEMQVSSRGYGRSPASNDDSFCTRPERPTAASFFEAALGAPPDWPHKKTALKNATCALAILSEEFAGLRTYLQTDLLPVFEGNAGAQRMERSPLAGRMGGHALYLLALHINPQGVVSHAGWKDINKIFGMWMLRRYLTAEEPTKASTNSLRRCLYSKSDIHRSIRTLQLMSIKAEAGLKAAIKQSHTLAVAIGLISEEISDQKEEIRSPEETFNREYLARVKQLIKYADARSVQGAAGHGALAKSAVKQAGEQLKLGVLAGEANALCACLQVITRMTPVELKSLPLKSGSEVPKALAWLDLESGDYCYSLDAVRDKKVVVNQHSAHLYRKSTPIVVIRLPDFVHKALRSLFREHRGMAKKLSDLLEVDLPNPRSALVPSEGYRITMRRLQESLPVLLLPAFNRWIVALSTSTPWLVSRGRRPYSVARQSQVNAALSKMYRYLGWTFKERASQEEFIGSDVCATTEAIGKVLNFIEQRCDGEKDNACADWLNFEAARLAFLSALCLGLRDRLTYPVPWSEIRRSPWVVVDDKKVREYPPPPIPVTSVLADGARRWNEAVERFLKVQEQENVNEAKALLVRIHALSENGGYPLFSIGDLGIIQPAGTSTWQSKLPPSLCLVGNFGRHFWPLALMDKSVPQRWLDLLMRHQSDYLVHYNCKGSIDSWQHDATALMQVMDEIIQEILLERGC